MINLARFYRNRSGTRDNAAADYYFNGGLIHGGGGGQRDGRGVEIGRLSVTGASIPLGQIYIRNISSIAGHIYIYIESIVRTLARLLLAPLAYVHLIYRLRHLRFTRGTDRSRGNVHFHGGRHNRGCV